LNPSRRGPLVAVDPGATGTHQLRSRERSGFVAWEESRAGPGFASPVVHGGHVYVIGSMGILACHDADSGERRYRERLPESATVVASP
jgi:hypothetical protein